MLRECTPADWPAVSALIKASGALSEAEQAGLFKNARGLLEDDGQIRGCLFLTTSTTGNRISGEIMLYVDPAHRGHGIGRRLFDAILPNIGAARPTILFARYIADDRPSAAFFAARGFEQVVKTHLMEYEGGAFPEPALDIRPYEDRFFADYIRINNEAFYDLRRAAGVDPLLYPPGADADQALREKRLSQRNSIYLLFVQEGPVGLAIFAAGFIYVIAVAPGFQGCGYGRGLMQFAVNRLREAGATTIRLDVGEPNLRARRLYESLGFRLTQAIQIAKMRDARLAALTP